MFATERAIERRGVIVLEHGLDMSGIGGCALIVLILAGLFLGGVMIPNALGNLADGQAQRELAEAALTRAETARDAQAAVDFRRDMMLWTVALKSAGDGALVVVATGLAALAGGYLVGMSRGPSSKS